MKQELEQLLAQNDTFMVEGALNKNKLAELARQYNPELLNLLMSDEKISNHFFSKLETGILVFKKDVFLQFLNNKEFLPDSFTAYKTKIGLATGEKYLSENNDVVLNFPYKDCILEGGQTKDDAKRQEIFFNETLAPTEINRLLDDKVLTNFKRYDETGEHNVEEIKDTDNLIIKGNNLIALHSLKKRFAGKVKLIYIDVPYNTGNDSFRYNDSFNHSSWLTFMKNRLIISKKLLSIDGLIFVQCDDNEQAYLKVMMDEIFGSENFINCIAVKMSEASGVKMNHAKSRMPKLKEYILLYKKEGFREFNEIDKYRVDTWDNENNIFLENFSITDRQRLIDIETQDENSDEEVFEANEILRDVIKVSLSDKIKEMNFKDEDDKNNWLFENSYRIVKTAGSSGYAKIVKSLESIPDQQLASALSKKKTIFYYITEFNRETKQPRLQVIFADSNIFKNPCDFWQDIKTTGAIANEGGVQLPNGKKPEKLLQRIIKMSTKESDVVLDYHLGSGTTAAVAHKMNRQYIGIEQMDYIEELVVNRLKNVINGEQTGISKDVNWTGGGSFVYAELKNDAQDFKNAIIQAITTEELLELFELAKKSSFLSYRIDPKKLKANEFEKLSLAEQKQIMFEIIDNNNLYVNYSDIDDIDYEISAQDKKLNHTFYGKEQ